MVYSLPCFLFVCFIFFVFGRFCFVSRGPAFSKQDKNSRALFLKRAQVSALFLKRAQVSDGVDTVIVFARIFGAHFYVSFLFVLLFVIFWGNFRSSGQRFFIFFNNKYGRARKKSTILFWAQLFLLNRSCMDYVMSDDLTSFFFFLIIFWECSHSTTFLGVGKPFFFPAIVSFHFGFQRSYWLWVGVG